MITLWDSLLSCRYRVQSKGQIESLQQLGIQASLQYTLTTDCLYFIFLIRIFNKETSSRLDFSRSMYFFTLPWLDYRLSLRRSGCVRVSSQNLKLSTNYIDFFFFFRKRNWQEKARECYFRSICFPRIRPFIQVQFESLSRTSGKIKFYGQ